MTANKQLRDIQQDYFAIYDRHLGETLREAVGFAPTQLPEFINRKLREPSIIVPFGGAELHGFEYAVVTFTREVGQFWVQYADTVFAALRANNGISIEIPYMEFNESLERDTKRLATYFDTVLIIDAFFPCPDQSSISRQPERNMILTNFRRAVAINRVRDLVLADIHPPLAAVVPSLGAPDVDQVNEYSLPFVRGIFGDRLDGFTSTLDIPSHLGEHSAEALLDVARRNPLFQRTLNDFDFTPIDRVFWNPQTGETNRVTCSLSDLPDHQLLSYFLTTVHARLSSLWEKEKTAAACGGDAVVGRRFWEIYKWYIEYSGRDRFTPPTFSEEELSARAVMQPELDFLGDITSTELMELRESSGLENIRGEIRKKHHTLKTIPIEEFPRFAESRAASLLEALAEFERELQHRLKRAQHGRALKYGSLGLTVTLGVASVACPLLAIPAAAFGVLVGTESLRTVINNHLSGKHKRRELLSRPMGILYQVNQRQSSSG